MQNGNSRSNWITHKAVIDKVEVHQNMKFFIKNSKFKTRTNTKNYKSSKKTMKNFKHFDYRFKIIK